MTTEYKYDVFISYSRKDYVDEATKEKIPGNVISIIKKSFDDSGITYWMDEEGNLTGKKFAHIIAGKIRESMVFLFVCSNNSVASKWVDRELSVADTFDKHIIPFICDNSYKDDKVVMFTAALDRVEFLGKHNKDNEIAKLVKSVKKDKEELEKKRKREEEILKQKQKEEEERKKREEQEKKKKEAVNEIKRLATDYKILSLQQDTIVQQLHEKNLIIGKETKKCPVCKASGQIETTFCEKCGFQFPQLYGVDGNESYPFDNRLLVTAKANYDAIAFAEKEKERLEKKVAELIYSFEKISVECEQQLKTISQKEAEVVSYRKKCEAFSIQLKKYEDQSEKMLELNRQKEALENSIDNLKDIIDKQREQQTKSEVYKTKIEEEILTKEKENQRNEHTIEELKKKIADLTSKSSEIVSNGTPQVELRCPEGAINGVFSVSQTKKVFFSKGNLQYQTKTGIWRFAENQFDIAEKVSSYYEHWIDLFGWGTGSNPMNYWRDSNLYPSFVDWGRNSIKNGGGQPNLWYTLKDFEWTYIFDIRSTKSGIRYAKACVNRVNGMILLPDNWNSNIYKLNSTNNPDVDYMANTMNISQWKGLEQYGAVFLPAAGYRIENSNYLAGIFGHYWSSSYSPNSYYSYNLYFNSGLLNSSCSEYRHYGFSVRLVRSAM